MQEESTETSLLQANVVFFTCNLHSSLHSTCSPVCNNGNRIGINDNLTYIKFYEDPKKESSTDIPAYFLFIDSLVSSKAPVTSNMYKKKKNVLQYYYYVQYH